MSADVLHENPPAVDLDLEREVLGCILVGETVVDALVGGLTDECFFRSAHRMTWRAAVDVANRGEHAGMLEVMAELKRRDQLDEVRPAYLTALMDGRMRRDADGLAWIIRKLRDLALVRKLRGLLAQSADELLASEAVAQSAAEIIAAIEAERSGHQTDRRTYDGAGQFDAMIADLQRDPGDAVLWGFHGLDDQIPGIYGGEVFGLMARPGIGKTLMLNHLTRRTVPLGHLFFSLEMPAAQIAARMARGIYGLNRYGLVGAGRANQLDPAQYIDSTRGLLVIDQPGLSVAQIDGLVRQHAKTTMRETPIRLITIDHLGLIGGDRSLSTYDRVSTQARELKELAKRHRCVVLVAIQVNREQGGDGSRELTLGAARDSGVVEEAVDYLLALRRLDRSREATAETREKFRDVLFLRVLKNRHGVLGDELAVRLNGEDLTLAEDPLLKAEEADMRDLLARRPRR